MSLNNQQDLRPNKGATAEPEVLDPALKAALADFRLSVHAWSDAVYSRQRQPLALTPRHRVWRLAAGWALGCVLLAGGFSAGVFEHHEREVRQAQAREAEHQRQLAAARAAQQAKEEEELLAHVDSDIARQVPSAMEPLARLMAEDETQ